MRRIEKIFEEDLSRNVAVQRVNAPVAYHVNLADLHYGLNDRGLFRENLDFLLSIPNLYFGIGGDCGNGASKISKGNPLEEWASGDKQLYAIAEDLKPAVDANRLLYIIEGNHLAGRYKDTTFHTPEELLAYILGKPSLFKGEQCFLYFNVNKNLYVHYIHHYNTKQPDYFQWINADVTWREHIHQNAVTRKITLDHNKYTKKPIVKVNLDVQSGHWQILPSYIKIKGIRPTPPGCYIVEMGGLERKLFAWDNEQFYHMVSKGYKVD